MRRVWAVAWVVVVGCGGEDGGGVVPDAGGAMDASVVQDAGAQEPDGGGADGQGGDEADAADAGRGGDGGALDAGPGGGNGCGALAAARVGACGGAWATLRPAVLLDGQWRGAGRDGDCTDDGVIRCPAGQGDVVASTVGGSMTVRFEAAEPATVEALALEGGGRRPRGDGVAVERLPELVAERRHRPRGAAVRRGARRRPRATRDGRDRSARQRAVVVADVGGRARRRGPGRGRPAGRPLRLVGPGAPGR